MRTAKTEFVSDARSGVLVAKVRPFCRAQVIYTIGGHGHRWARVFFKGGECSTPPPPDLHQGGEDLNF